MAAVSSPKPSAIPHHRSLGFGYRGSWRPLVSQMGKRIERLNYSHAALSNFCIRNRKLHARRAAVALDAPAGEWPFLNPLLLAYFASQKRSLFATKSLVYIAMELYKQGQHWEDIQLELNLAGMQERREVEQVPAKDRKKAELLVEIGRDVLLQWIALIFMTLKELGVKQGSADASPLDSETQMAKGMRGFVRQTLQLGYSLEKLQLQQQMAEEQGGDPQPSVRLMQENARLIVLTSLAGFTAAHRPLHRVSRKTWQIVRGVAGGENIQEAAAPELKPESLVGPGLRESAARVLLAFLGAAKGSLYSVNAFLEEVFWCYRKGWTAQELFGALRPEEFASGKSLFPVVAARGSAQANAEIFAQWVSAIYITLVQVGVPHDKAEESSGWAWAGTGSEDDAISATRLASFVSSTLKTKAEEDGVAVVESQALEAIRGQPPAPRNPAGPGFVVVQDESIRESSSAVALMSQLHNIILLTRDLARKTMRGSTVQSQGELL